MALVNLGIPVWVSGIIAAMAVFIVGFLVLAKIKSAVKDLVYGLNLSRNLSDGIVDFFSATIIIYIIGRSLTKLPSITNSGLIPFTAIGEIMRGLVSFAFQLLVPLALLYVGMSLYNGGQ